jgi:hypothetical protein
VQCTKFDVCIVFKYLNESDSPSYLQNMLCLKRTAYNTRSIDTEAKTLVVPVVKRKTFASRSFAIAGSIVWKELPNNVRTISTFNDFKRHLKAFYFTTCFLLRDYVDLYFLHFNYHQVNSFTPYVFASIYVQRLWLHFYCKIVRFINVNNLILPVF